jgi:hypothetical protein
MENKSLFDDACVLNITFKSFGTSRKLKDDQYEVEANKKKTRATKNILQGKELKAIKDCDTETRDWIKQRTIPTGFKAGLDAVKLSMVPQVNDYLTAQAEKRMDLVRLFADSLPDLKFRDSLAKEDGGLEQLYDEKDYPTSSQAMIEYWRLEWSFSEIMAAGKLKSISASLYEAEREKAQLIWSQAIEDGQALLRGQWAKIIDHMSECLAPSPEGKKKVFRDSLVTNAIEFLQTFDCRNVGDSQELKDQLNAMTQALQGVTADDLRKNETVKARVLATTEKIKSELSAMVTDKPGRKISLESDEWGSL